MTAFDWHRCRFLESIENLRPLVHARIGKTPSATIAREITACLQQGRQFYEAAKVSPLEIRPLQLFYGMVGFAKALVVARTLSSLSTLRHTHGLSDISTQGSRIAELRIRIGAGGTFQEFNDVAAELPRLCYFGEAERPQAIYLPSFKSNRINNLEMSLRDILSRVPGLETLFQATFGEDAGTAPLELHQEVSDRRFWRLRVDDPQLFQDRGSLGAIVGRWRTRFPFLNTWSLISAQHAWGYSVIEFLNVDNAGMDEFAEDHLVSDNNRYSATLSPERRATPFNVAECISPVGGGYSERSYAISPIRSCYLSELSLHYLGLFLLSSLVRYRPQTWTHAISRTAVSVAPADDQALSLVECFLDVNSSLIPSMIVEVLNPHEDRYK